MEANYLTILYWFCHTSTLLILEYNKKYNNDEQVWNIDSITKLWHEDWKCANAVGKVVLIDLTNSGLPLIINLWKTYICEELIHWKRPWCWERLRAGGEGDDDKGWDGWLASSTHWTWVWVDPESWWWTGRPGVLRFMGSQRVGHDWATELNCYICEAKCSIQGVPVLWNNFHDNVS